MSKVQTLAKKCGYKKAKFLCLWKGYKVYEAVFEKDANIGEPCLILDKDGDVQIAEQTVVWEILKSLPDEEE